MIEPIKISFAEFMGRFYAGLSPTTKQLPEYIARGLAKSIQWAPSRMIDSAEEMLAAWQKNDTDSAPTHPPKLPVIIIAMARDYTPTRGDFNCPFPVSAPITLDEDVKKRIFIISTSASDIRVQITIFSSDPLTAYEIANQMKIYCSAPERRSFKAYFKTPIGTYDDFTVVIEDPDLNFMSARGDAKNLCILVADITLKATIPMYSAPSLENPNNDQSGVPGTDDPSGYLGVDYVLNNPGELQ